MKIDQLRLKHPSLSYHGYQLSWINQQLQLQHYFSLQPDIVFKAQVSLGAVSSEYLANKNPQILHQLFVNLGLAEIASYWKCACPAKIYLDSSTIGVNFSQEQLAWWQDLLIQGMSEFYLVNQIDFTAKDFVTISTTKDKQQAKIPALSNLQTVKELIELARDNLHRKKDLQEKNSPVPKNGLGAKKAIEVKNDLGAKKAIEVKNDLGAKKAIVASNNHYLVPVGGGKDSALVLGILDANQQQYGCLLLEPHSPSARQIARQSQAQQLIYAKRQIDPQLLKLNKAGYLNGHTPFSAYLAFLSSLSAYLFNYQSILLANERSANEGNQQYLGITVNHQYSKSFAFEKAFRNYAKQFLFSLPNSQINSKASPKDEQKENQSSPTNPEYLSFLRPLWEIQIAQTFAKHPQFHRVFKSCNVGQQQAVWCEHCPKCLFVFTMLYPFMDEGKLCHEIFSHNLFEDASLQKTGLALAGWQEQKPLECVGTFAESQVAFYLAIKKYLAKKQALPIVLQTVKEKVLDLINSNSDNNYLEKLSQQLLSDWHQQHFLSPELATMLKKALL